MGNCKDCKWWWAKPKKHTGHFTYLNPYGRCIVANQGYKDELIMVLDGDDNEPGHMYTKPEFGCVWFEQKADDNAPRA